MPVRQLPEQIVNRIAAGEVVERPASVVKELVENAIDAGASRIDIFTDGGGRRKIVITDDGGGMTATDLALAVDRHATSKLDDEDLLQIKTLGFRGEALPSIGAVAKLSITTRHASEPHAWPLSVEGGAKSDVMPAALAHGTRVEVTDLFYATPARLKFLKTDRTEAEAIREIVRRLAMARPDIAFTLAGEERAPVTWAAALPGAAGQLTRLGDILGADFRSARHRRPRRARGRVGRGLCRRAVADPGQRARAISLRQRPAGARQADPGRGARGLCRLSAARPPSRGGAVRHARPARGRRQRASGQDRGALPQRRPGARADRARAEGGTGARRPAHRGQQRRRGDRVLPSRVRAAARQLGLAALAVLPGRHRRRRSQRRPPRSPNRTRPPSTSARRPPTCGSRRSRPPISSTVRSARRARRSTRPISCRRPATALSSSTSTPRMSASSMSG